MTEEAGEQVKGIPECVICGSEKVTSDNTESGWRCPHESEHWPRTFYLCGCSPEIANESCDSVEVVPASRLEQAERERDAHKARADRYEQLNRYNVKKGREQAEQAEQRIRELEENFEQARQVAMRQNAERQAAESRLAEVEGALGYIATMLEGDTDRNQIAQYIRNDVLSNSKGDEA